MSRVPLHVSVLVVAVLPLLFAWQAVAATPRRAVSPDQPPAGGARLFKSGPIQVTADGRWVWVANAYAESVARIDTRDNSVANFPLPDSATHDVPRGIAVTEDGAEVWVAAQDADRVYVLDGSDGHARAEIALPWGSGPYSVALSPPDATSGRQPWALVTLHRAAALAAIDTATRAVTLLAPVFRSPFGIAWTEDGKMAWVTHIVGDDEHPHITGVDFSGPSPRVTVHLNAFATSPRQTSQLKDDVAARNLAEGGYLNFRGHPAQVPSTTGKQQMWIPTQYHNMTEDTPSPDSSIEVSLRKFELTTMRLSNDDKIVLTAKHVHDPTKGDNNPPWLGYGWDAGMSGAVDLGFATIGGGLYALLLGEQSNDLAVFPWDTKPFRSKTDPTAPKLPELAVGHRPMGLAISPAGPTAYVYNAFSFDVSVVDLADPNHPAQHQRIALAPPLASDPLDDPTRLAGARLFFSSADPRISANDKVACASCHINGEQDGRTWRFEHLPPGTAGQEHGPRSTISLLGLGLTHTPGQRDPVTGWGQLHHSGDRDEVQDFEHTFRGPQMGGRGFLGEYVQDELRQPNAGRNADLDALAAYLLSVPPLPHSPYRAPDGGLSEAAVRGATIFVGTDPELRPADARCATCHVPETGFVDFGFHDVGQYRDSTEQELNDNGRRSQCLWCTNTPTLVGVWDSEPWEGTWRYAGTFLEVLADFAGSGRPASHGYVNELSGRQLRDLAEFVQSIDGNLTADEVRRARDTTPPRIVRVAPTSLTRVEVWFSETVDAVSAEDSASYRIVDLATGAAMPVTGATLDRQHGDRVTLATLLTATAAGTRYRLEPAGAIRDVADSASGGQANPIDLADPTNQHTFTLSETLTITLGASGYENLTIPVHDASPIGPGLSTWDHDRVEASTTAGSGTIVPGFVRFEWRGAFLGATGATSADDILDARFQLDATAGDAPTVELRRVLQAWRDPASGGDWNSDPVGGPTWRDHAHPGQPWNRAGAGALGGTGADPRDYNGRYDLADRVDAELELPAINQPVSFAEPLVTEAVRFWFDHPELDYGYAVRVIGTRPSQVFVRFQRSESDLRLHSPVLAITYRLPAGSPVVPTATAPGPAPSPPATPRTTTTPVLPRPSATPRPVAWSPIYLAYLAKRDDLATARSTWTPTVTRTPRPTAMPTSTWAPPSPTPRRETATPRATATPMPSPYDGTWSGRTSQGQILGFTIENGAIVTGSAGYRNGGCSRFIIQASPPGRIRGDTILFTLTEQPGPTGYITVDGSFQSGSTASGTLDARGQCGEVDATWQATRSLAQHGDQREWLTPRLPTLWVRASVGAG